MLAHLGIGNVYLGTGRRDEAERTYHEALALVHRHGSATASLYPNVLGCLAAARSADGRHDEALADCVEAMRLAAVIGDQSQQAQLQLQIALIHQRRDDRPGTAAAAGRAAVMFDVLGQLASARRARALAAGTGPAR